MTGPPSPRCVVVNNVPTQVFLCGSPYLAMCVSLMLVVGSTCTYPIPDSQRKLRFTPLQGQAFLQHRIARLCCLANKCLDMFGTCDGWLVSQSWGDVGRKWKLWPWNKRLSAAWGNYLEVCQWTGRDAGADIQQEAEMLPFRSPVRGSTSKPDLSFLLQAGSLTVCLWVVLPVKSAGKKL